MTTDYSAFSENDFRVVGNSIENVQGIYGEFDVVYGNKKGYYIGDDNFPVMPSHAPIYYWMVHDDTGIVKEVYVNTKPGG